jgi:hypothetical protein
VALLGGAAAVVMGTIAANDSSGGQSTTTTAKPRPPAPPPPPTKPPPAPPGRPVKLAGIAAFDPEGDKSENDDLAPEATDGDAATSWRTEHYRDFFKPGVGLVLDARRRATVTRVVVRSDTPGFQAEIQTGNSPQGPFAARSPRRPVGRATTFVLRKGAAARYVVVWITDMPNDFAAHVNEVTARSG